MIRHLIGGDDIQHLLHGAGFAGQWTIARASEGSLGRTFVARQGDRALLVKLDDANPCGARLAGLGITPPLLAQGAHSGTPYSVYAHVAAEHPSPGWFGEHLSRVLDLIATCQRDPLLATQLGAANAPPLITHLTQEMASLQSAIESAEPLLFRVPGIWSAMRRLAAPGHGTGLDTVSLVPAHTDPNNTNVLIAPEHTYLVDWDGITLSDPLRDIGLILWWYVPEERWPGAFSRMGIPTTDHDAAASRVYWWSAINSLRVALWIDRHAANDGAIESFLADFTAAAHGLSNPKRSAPRPLQIHHPSVGVDPIDDHEVSERMRSIRVDPGALTSPITHRAALTTPCLDRLECSHQIGFPRSFALRGASNRAASDLDGQMPGTQASRPHVDNGMCAETSQGSRSTPSGCSAPSPRSAIPSRPVDPSGPWRCPIVRASRLQHERW